MTTHHSVIFSDARELTAVPDCSVDLVVTSPPYPMIQMWDDAFCEMNPAIAKALATADGPLAFALMHLELDRVWRHCHRALKPGGITCINIGDAVRTLGKNFRIYPNHARILTAMTALGFGALPDILWRKQTNAPNKFMGSGMLPAGAYVTYEHEYVLIFRKGARRRFTAEAEKANRAASAYFWEERNLWFSDLWTDLKGADQDLCDATVRARSAAFPMELAFRLILMHSVYGDTVLDPFLGTGTTTAAAVAACRNSIGVESRRDLAPAIRETISNAVSRGSCRALARLAGHDAFVKDRLAARRPLGHTNLIYGFPVMTSQEEALAVREPRGLTRTAGWVFEATHRRVAARSRAAGAAGAATGRPGPRGRPQSR